jgi:hypothetical protein
MKGKGSNLSQMINDLFLGVLSTTFSLEIMKNYLRDQISSLTRGWHVLRGGEFGISALEGFEMLTTLLFQKVQYRLRARRCPMSPTFDMVSDKRLSPLFSHWTKLPILFVILNSWVSAPKHSRT